MGRKPNESKHPATKSVALKQVSDDIIEQDQNLAKELSGWNTFTNDEQRFLLVANGFSSESEAANYIGKSSRWVIQHKRAHPLFKEAVTIRKGHSANITTTFASGLLAKAIAAYDEILTKQNGKYNASLSTVLQAATTIFKMNDPNSTEVLQGTQVYAKNVQMFQIAGSAKDDNPS